MIGVVVHSGQEEIAREFFELFKTPWEFCKCGQRYNVLISTQDEWPRDQARLVLLYNAERISFDAENNVPVRACSGGAMFSYAGCRVPLYGPAASFPSNRFCIPMAGADEESMTFLSALAGNAVLRIGYDLFEETRLLLTVGQPPANAGTATLELHIALLRELITRSGLPLVEIPPVPDGYNFIACLTHDLDHPVLRNHCMDHTMLGFLYRSTLGSLIEVCRGRKGPGDLCQNWAAAGKLPFVYLGLAKDPWRCFNRYLEMEEGLGSTYFVMPRRDYAGRCDNGPAPAKRASRYAVSDIRSELQEIISRGSEVGLHGIDAWLEVDSGRKERQEIIRALGDAGSGVRMHWLFFDENSPAHLEQAGFLYDSSVGYNETVGYRAGTAQAYQHLGATRLLELPLHVMDTALFFPEFLNLSDADAEHLVWGILDGVLRFGGALTINWHDRSILPERLWDKFYGNMLQEFKRRRAWFPTGSQAVAWFRKRRSASVETARENGDRLRVKGRGSPPDGLPSLKIRIHKPRAGYLWEPIGAKVPTEYVDVRLDDEVEFSTAI